jgi:hypothetical protein
MKFHHFLPFSQCNLLIHNIIETPVENLAMRTALSLTKIFPIDLIGVKHV